MRECKGGNSRWINRELDLWIARSILGGAKITEVAGYISCSAAVARQRFRRVIHLARTHRYNKAVSYYLVALRTDKDVWLTAIGLLENTWREAGLIKTIGGI